MEMTQNMFMNLLTVILQDQTITNGSKPIQLGSVFTSVLCWVARFYKHRDVTESFLLTSLKNAIPLLN